MLGGFSRQAVGVRRLIGATALLFVLFLPFHIHLYSANAELTQDCACCCGMRTQAAPAPVPADLTPDFIPTFIEILQPQIVSLVAATSPVIRGPPQNA